MFNKLKENKMKHILLTQDEIRTLQHAIDSCRSHLSRQKENKTTQEWIQSNGEHSDTHNIHMKNLGILEDKIHGRMQ